MTDIRDLLGEGFPAVERGSIKVFPDGLPAEWFKFLDESPWFIKGMSPEHAMQIASMLATDAFLTIQIWANEAWRQRELRRELAAALRERDQALAAAREEIERMKVCCLCSRLTGNWVFMCCAEMMEENSAENPDEWPHSSTVVKLDDHCHFTPSRWTPRTPKEA